MTDSITFSRLTSSLFWSRTSRNKLVNDWPCPSNRHFTPTVPSRCFDGAANKTSSTHVTDDMTGATSSNATVAAEMARETADAELTMTEYVVEGVRLGTTRVVMVDETVTAMEDTRTLEREVRTIAVIGVVGADGEVMVRWREDEVAESRDITVDMTGRTGASINKMS